MDLIEKIVAGIIGAVFTLIVFGLFLSMNITHANSEVVYLEYDKSCVMNMTNITEDQAVANLAWCLEQHERLSK